MGSIKKSYLSTVKRVKHEPKFSNYPNPNWFLRYSSFKVYIFSLNDDSPVVNTKGNGSRCIYFQQICKQLPFIPKYNKYAKKYTSKTQMNSPILTIQLIKIHYSSTSKLTKLIHVYSLLKADKTTNPHYL